MAYIKKEPITKFITDGLNNPDKSKAFGHDAIEILTEIEYAPTADVVEVVRCKDCIHRSKDDFYSFFCRRDDVGCKDDGFCSDGERRTANDL